MRKCGFIFLAFMAMVLSMSAQENKATSAQRDSSRIFVDYFENAQFPGGDEACMKWLQDHIKYPEGYTSNQPQGKVVVSFIVEKDGSLDGIKVMKSPDPLLSEEAIRVVREMPKWKPAHQYFPPPRQGSEAVRSRFFLPVIFRQP